MKTAAIGPWPAEPVEQSAGERQQRCSAGVMGGVWLRCDLAAVREAALAARSFLAAQGVADNDLAACELALVEACNNAILYARGAGCERLVEIQALCHGPRLELHVIDHTPGFDWPSSIALPQPEAEHGRGLFIIQSQMDELL